MSSVRPSTHTEKEGNLQTTSPWNPVRLRALIRAPDGLTRTQLSHHVHRNLPAEQLDRALQALTAAGRAKHTRINTGGRPAERWHASLPASAPAPPYWGRGDAFENLLQEPWVVSPAGEGWAESAE
jgi:hypothetical protein